MVKVKTTKLNMVNEVRTFYMAIFKKLYGFNPMMNFARSGAVIKRLLNNGITEYQFYLLICIHFTWKGVDGNNEYIHKRYKDNAYPIEWISTSVNSYMAYIRNVLNIDFDNEDDVRSAVSEFIKEIS